LTQHFSNGRAIAADIESNMTNERSPAWGLRLTGADETRVREALGVVARASNQPITWGSNNRSSFELGKWSGSIASPHDWLYYWLSRYEVQALLAVMSGGTALLPLLDGSDFGQVDRPAAIARLQTFLQLVLDFTAGPSTSGVKTSLSPGWQVVFDELDHEGADQVAAILSTTESPVVTVDPRAHYLFLGDKETAQLVATMVSEFPSVIADWDGEATSFVAPEDARTTLEEFLAGDLALFLECGYPSTLELADPRTEIPLSSSGD